MSQTLSVPQECHPPLFSPRDLRQLIGPLIVEQFLLMTVGMADTVMVTSAGEAAIAGVSLVDNINVLLIQVFAALSTGGAVVVSQYLGRQEERHARAAAKQLLYAVTLVSALIMVLALLFREQILSLLFGDIESDVMESALLYFLSTALAYPVMSIYNAGAALFRSMGESRTSMVISLIVNVVNITVNAILIYAFQLGALGAGIGTLVSRIVAAVVVLFLLLRPSCPLKPERPLHPEFQWVMVRRILTIGVPNGLEGGLFQAGKLVVLNLITSFGTAAVAANGIAGSICSVVNVPGQAIGLAMVTVVGQCVGAQYLDQAVFYTRKLMLTAYGLMGGMCLILFFSAGGVVSILDLSPEAAALAREVLRWNAVFTALFWPLSFTLPNALRAAGDAVFTMAVSLLSMALFRIVFSYLLACSWGLGLGLLGVWIAMFIDWIVRCIVFLIHFLRGKWKQIQLI